MLFDNHHLIVRQQILPQNSWCLSLKRRFYPSHMMWHNLWPQTQNISADVNTFSFHVLNIADQAKFHFTEKTTFFLDRGREKLVRVQTWYLCLCPFSLQPLQSSPETSLHHKEAKQRNVNLLLVYKFPGSSSSHCHLFSDRLLLGSALPKEVLLERAARVKAEIFTNIVLN